MLRQSAAGRHSIPAKLPLAWDAVIVSIHLHAGAVSEKVSRLGTRRHLRAMGSPIAIELWAIG